MSDPKTVPDEAFDLSVEKPLSPETLARGTRYPTDAEHQAMLKNISQLDVPADTDTPAK